MSKRFQIFDRLSFDTSKWYTDEDGNMRVPVIIARTGVLEYQYQDADGQVATLREAKLPEELLTKHVLFSAEGKPVTDEHPPEMVSSKNYQKYAKGVFINPKIVNDSIHGEIVIYDSKLQEDIRNGIKYQLSPGFWSSTEFKKGEFEGKTFDAIQKDIYINHIAIVKDGRAGHDVRIKLDSSTIREIKNFISEVDVAKRKTRKDELLNKEKIDEYEETVKKSEKEDGELGKTEIKDQDETEPDEEKKDQEMSEPDEEKKEDEDEMSTEEKLKMLMTENKMLKERLSNSDSKKLDASYMEARDIALQNVTDKKLNPYHDDVNYYRKAVIDAAGYDSRQLVGKGELIGAFNIAKTILQNQNTVLSPSQIKSDSIYKNDLEKAREQRIELSNSFVGKRQVKEAV